MFKKGNRLLLTQNPIRDSGLKLCNGWFILVVLCHTVWGKCDYSILVVLCHTVSGKCDYSIL